MVNIFKLLDTTSVWRVNGNLGQKLHHDDVLDQVRRTARLLAQAQFQPQVMVQPLVLPVQQLPQEDLGPLRQTYRRPQEAPQRAAAAQTPAHQPPHVEQVQVPHELVHAPHGLQELLGCDVGRQPARELRAEPVTHTEYGDVP